MRALVELIRSSSSVVAMTGAGVSTLCGIPDFRGPQGLYRQPDAERIFDIDWFRRDPAVYYRGCRELVYGLARYEPGPVHLALRRLEEAGRLRGIITQNIDMLHQRAGSGNVWEVHGSPLRHHCFECGAERTFDEILAMLGKDEVPRCQCGGAFKPDITFFGESLPEAAFAAARDAALKADLMLVLGTSLTVYPAAGLPQLTLRAGGRLAIVNAQPTALDDFAVFRGTDLAAFAKAVQAAF